MSRINMDMTAYDDKPEFTYKYTFEAYCTSDGCIANSPKNELGAHKTLSKDHSWCPDCNYALLWVRKAIK